MGIRVSGQALTEGTDRALLPPRSYLIRSHPHAGQVLCTRVHSAKLEVLQLPWIVSVFGIGCGDLKSIGLLAILYSAGRV
jgi:hypothetical protein